MLHDYLIHHLILYRYNILYSDSMMIHNKNPKNNDDKNTNPLELEHESVETI